MEGDRQAAPIPYPLRAATRRCHADVDFGGTNEVAERRFSARLDAARSIHEPANPGRSVGGICAAEIKSSNRGQRDAARGTCTRKLTRHNGPLHLGVQGRLCSVLGNKLNSVRETRELSVIVDWQRNLAFYGLACDRHQSRTVGLDDVLDRLRGQPVAICRKGHDRPEVTDHEKGN